MGKEALINGQWKKVGDKIGDAKIIAIKPTEVVIEWEGKEKAFAPIGAVSSFGPEKKPKRPAAKKIREKFPNCQIYSATAGIMAKKRNMKADVIKKFKG